VVTRGWYLGATDLGSELGATDLGAELGAKIYGSELFFNPSASLFDRDLIVIHPSRVLALLYPPNLY